MMKDNETEMKALKDQVDVLQIVFMYETINIFFILIKLNKKYNVMYFFQIQFVSLVYKQLQELNFELEMEHCTSLQDVDILDSQVYKYQSLLKSEEVAINVII